MIFKFDKETLSYKKITGKTAIIFLSLLLTSILVCCLLIANNINKVNFISEETKAIILKEADKENEFSEKKLKAYLLELNIKYPHIVMAQAKIETGNFTSQIFKENNNLFGMKVANKRPSTNKGEQYNHAYYNNWKESVVDYAFFAAAYLNKIKTEDEYLEYLRQNYAEDTTYVSKIINIVKSEN